MFRHLLKLIWKRKGRNLMLSLEILLAFAVVFAVAGFGLRYAQLYRMPIGFNGNDVWAVDINGKEKGDTMGDEESDKFRRGLLALPEVQHVAFVSAAPFKSSTWRTDYTLSDGRKVVAEILVASDDVFATLNVPLAQGRAFSHSDDGASATPVVINRGLAQEMFGQASAIGQQFTSTPHDGKPVDKYRVVGLVDAFRKKGELDSPGNMAIVRQLERDKYSLGVNTILIKLAPGTPRAFEEQLTRQLKSLNNNWNYEIAPLSALRQSMLNTQLTPVIVLGVIAAFLLLMVAFGLFGVLWQNTTRRIPEIGLRRAIGAHAGDIYRQIIAEQFLLSTGAMLVALLLLVQLPLTGVLGESLNWGVFLAATALSMTVIYLLSLLCSVYPGWRASRLSPTEALHYE
ncbi:MAG: ABC transporter permease [Massilia sp.]